MNIPFRVKLLTSTAKAPERANPLYPSSFEIVEDFKDTGRGGYGSTGK